MDRENEDWLSHLRSSGGVQEAAINDLRVLLLHRLRKGLPGDLGKDDSFLDDVCQGTLIRILAKLDAFEGRSHFLTWATSIGVRIALTEQRRRRWVNVSMDDLEADLPGREVAETSSLEQQDAEGFRQGVFECMRRIIATDLTDKQRTALELELQGMPQEEIARQLGTSRNALYKLTHDARKNLKRGMESEGYGANEILNLFAR
jgi:RNA polymerase sigma-70 factor (ECF subfamily)